VSSDQEAAPKLRLKPDDREDAAGAILYVAERATLVALQILGGNGYTNDYLSPAHDPP
jgi:alkylation response protein AidB-like acyl-CoA dehydrogenase